MKRYLSLIVFVFGTIAFIGINHEMITQRYLKFFYYLPKIMAQNNVDIESMIRKVDQLNPIERSKSLYQYVDIFDYPYIENSSIKNATILTLDTNFQFSTVTEYSYHQAFSHVPIALNKKIPKRVLVLGGGDGLLIREILKYKEIESIHHIELDKKMVDLANSRFAYLNQNSLKDPRVQVEISDGFYYLRNTHDKYDAIFIDFPYPNSYDLAKLYSVEFYRFVVRALNEDGFAIFDAPFYDRSTRRSESVPEGMEPIFNERHFVNNSIFASTVYYAGFRSILPYQIEDETFLFLKVKSGGIDLESLESIHEDFLGPQVQKDVREIKNLNFPYRISLKFVNSIFRPTIARKEDF